MNTSIKKFIPLLAIAVVILLVGAVIFFTKDKEPADGRGIEGEPIDITLDFYEKWMTSLTATSTDPFSEDLHNSQEISKELSDKLWAFKNDNPETILDPVLCQVALPGGLRSLPVYRQEESAQILVMSSDKTLHGQAVVSLEKTGKLWRISDITCSSGEEDPNKGEFSFDKEGFLLKNVPAPLDSQYWHLVFEEDGTLGHTAPLFVDSSSMCKQGDTESACDTNNFEETKRVHVQGQMTESGVEVKKIEFLN